MPIDAYSVCPGGTGKKVKFCCPDILPDLEKIMRMIEGEQYQGCLQYIERMEQQGRPRECLMAIKGELLRGTEQIEAAVRHNAVFLEKFPENAIAWAEAATLAALTDSGRAAVSKLQRAISLSGNRMEARLYHAIGLVASVLIEEGDWAAGRALLHLQMTLSPDDTGPVQRAIRINRSADVPLLLKGEPPLIPPPDDAPWKARCEQALAPLRSARWQEAADALATLAAEIAEAPAIWQNLAVVRGWLADDDGVIEAWRRFASLPVPLEDAVEAEATAMMLSKDPLGDALDMVHLTWTVRDPDRLQELMLSDRRLVQVPFDPAVMASEDSPPPRLISVLLDRPMPEDAENVTLDTIPRYHGQALLFGRQTDRQGRVEVVGLTAWDIEPAKALLGQLGGDVFDGEPRQEVVQQVSASQQLLSTRWYAPRGVPPERLAALGVEFQRVALLEKWPKLPLGILQGESPEAAAADPAHQARLLAAVMVLEHWNERSAPAFDFNELRTKLGLPIAAPIDPAESPIEKLPMVRLSRVIVEKLSDDDLLQAFRRATLFGAAAALRKFGRAIVERPSLADKPERFQAYNVLAQTAESIEQALGHIDDGRQEALRAGRSCASWDLLELTYRFTAGDAREAMQLMQHIQQRHFEEPGIARALTQILIEVGVLRPDGTPAMPTGPQGAAAGPEAASAQAPPAAAPSRIWTPGSETGGGGGGGKLWTPE